MQTSVLNKEMQAITCVRVQNSLAAPYTLLLHHTRDVHGRVVQRFKPCALKRPHPPRLLAPQLIIWECAACVGDVGDAVVFEGHVTEYDAVRVTA